jgi:hypothetical protein
MRFRFTSLCPSDTFRRGALFSEQSPFSVGSHGGWAGRSPAASTPKGLKDQKDEKDQKEMKELRDEIRTSKEMDKDQKDLKDVTEVPSPEPKGPVQDLGGLNQLITRVSGLEQSVEESKGLKK